MEGVFSVFENDVVLPATSIGGGNEKILSIVDNVVTFVNVEVLPLSPVLASEPEHDHVPSDGT